MAASDDRRGTDYGQLRRGASIDFETLGRGWPTPALNT